jgi:O-antigen/teichoic acid export membrane protein
VARALHVISTKGWLKPFRNAGILALGRGGQGILQLGAVAIAAQALGAAGFGALVLINTLRQLVGGVAKLRSKHVVIRYGAQALERGNSHELSRVVGFALVLDAVSAVLALTVILVGTGPIVAWLNVPPEHTGTARLFGTCVAFVALSTSSEALLRSFDRFRCIAIQNTLGPLVQVCGSAIAFWLDGDLFAFLTVWFLGVATGRLYLIAAAARELRRRSIFAQSLASALTLRAPYPGLWRFVWTTNISDVLAQLRQHGSVLAIGALLDPTAAGIVRVAQQLGGLPGRPTGKILRPAVAPALASQTAAQKYRKRSKTVWRSALLAGGFAVAMFAVLVAFGEPLLRVVFGPEFTKAYVAVLIFGVAGVIRMLTFTLSPLLISAARTGAIIAARAIGLSMQLGILVLLAQPLGYEGAALAELGAVIVSNIILFHAVRQEMRRPAVAPSGPPQTP